ncbi:MAG: uracil phosphoribosyltransferase [Bacteroidales bacterium]|nr:uracil phosphoribosyltransferase [Bacteroidales bacterium]
MKVINLGETNSVMNRFVAELRDKTVQKDSMRFRRNLERLGEIFAYEISKKLKYETTEVETPLGIAECSICKQPIVLSTILRAGLPLHQGLLNYFDKAENSFIAAYRKYGKDNKFKIELEYASSVSTDGKILIIADPMLATGSSLVLAYQKLVENGEPIHTHIVCSIASTDGIDYLSKHLPHKSVTLWVAAVDEVLTNKSYIVPGLGDAGDLAYGVKL